MMKRALIGVLLLAACSGTAPDVSDVPDIPETTAQVFAAHLADIDRPAIVNVWASWCLPCRSEAPLLDQAHNQYGDQIEFIGVDVQDDQTDAKEFLAEFGLADFDHFFDRDREVPNFYGAIGTPVTMFFGPNGELIETHNGVVDERTLALNIDELLRLGS
jgi:cytochrome c biogenesis protein CcmG/thiol:disulfide interchange protein DsbE